MTIYKLPSSIGADRNNVYEVFETIYAKNIWGNGSGGGSHPLNTLEYADYLQKFLRQFHIKSVVDLGCGDWQFSKFIDWTAIHYTGIDVVADVINQNKKLYAASNIEFLLANPLDEKVLIAAADLLIIKDVLQHLSNANVLKILRYTQKYKYCLITNDFDNSNLDCQNGDTRPLNIKLPPFSVNALEVLSVGSKKTFLIDNSGGDKSGATS